MPWKITNVSLDAAHAMKRRTAKAARLEMEPVIAGARLRLKKTMTISDDLYEVNKTRLIHFEAQGVITFEKIDKTSHKPAVKAKPAKAEPVKAPEPKKAELPPTPVQLPVPVVTELPQEKPEPVKPTLPSSIEDEEKSGSSKRRRK
jgi:outer membrane biosynthesis protein TonB